MPWSFAAQCGLKAEVMGSRGFADPELQTVGLGECLDFDTRLPVCEPSLHPVVSQLRGQKLLLGPCSVLINSWGF